MGVKVLSLYDGMSCGSIAFKNLGIEVDEYIAYEIDKYAIAVTQHNFPNVIQMGDVYGADFTQHKDIDWLIGGFPCTKFSIAQKNDRETEPYSGLGWELFMHYKRALNEAKPKYFLAENNKSMAKPIRDEISRLFGFEPIGINSALVSAQNRQRLYWVGKREPDGTYSKVDVKQPEDKGILLRDILDSAVAWQEKAYALTTRCQGAIPEDTLERHRHTMVAEPVNTCEEKSHTLKAQYYKNGIANFICNDGFAATAVAEPVDITADGKAQTLRATCYKDGIRNLVGNNIDKKTCVAEPVRVPEYGNPDKARPIEALYANHTGTGEGSLEKRLFSGNPNKQQNDLIAEPVRIGDLPNSDGHTNGSQAMRIYSHEGKLVNLVAGGGGMGGKTGLYAVPVASENARLFATSVDGKWTLSNSITAKVKMPVYIVSNGLITIKDKRYPIKLADGFYIIRKLTVSECMRLQTVPEWYDFSVISNSQAYKCLGNGWSVDVIVHLIESAVKCSD